MAKNWKKAHDVLLAQNATLKSELQHQTDHRRIFQQEARESSRALRVSLKMLRGAAEVLKAHGKPESASAIFAFADHTEFKEESAWGDGNAKARG